MRTFDQLTKEEQSRAEEVALNELLRTVLEGLRFNDDLNKNDLQKRVDHACEKAESMRTPWFAHEYIMDTCSEELKGMARADAVRAQYPSSEERVIWL